MPALTIKNIPADLYDRLKKSARQHLRSINSEVIFFIQRALEAVPLNPVRILFRARELRKKTAG